MKTNMVCTLLVAAILCGSISAKQNRPQRLITPSMNKLNTKAQRDEGRRNLHNFFKAEKQVRAILKEAANRTFSPKEVKVRVNAIVMPLKSYFQALYPGRNVSQEIVAASILARDPSGKSLGSNIFLEFFKQNDIASMNKFFQSKVTDHQTLIQACNDFLAIADDLKASLSEKAKAFYRSKHPGDL